MRMFKSRPRGSKARAPAVVRTTEATTGKPARAGAPTLARTAPVNEGQGLPSPGGGVQSPDVVVRADGPLTHHVIWVGPVDRSGCMRVTAGAEVSSVITMEGKFPGAKGPFLETALPKLTSAIKEVRKQHPSAVITLAAFSAGGSAVRALDRDTLGLLDNIALFDAIYLIPPSPERAEWDRVIDWAQAGGHLYATCGADRTTVNGKSTSCIESAEALSTRITNRGGTKQGKITFTFAEDVKHGEHFWKLAPTYFGGKREAA